MPDRLSPDEKKFEKYLGYKVAAFEVDHYRPRDELIYMMYTQVDQQVARFAMRGDRTMFLFVFQDEDTEQLESVDAQKKLLRKRFGDSGWECPQILEALDTRNDLDFDRLSQIRMPIERELWTRGRVTLVGDAAFCVSFLAGQGSALTMVAAYVLGRTASRQGKLHRSLSTIPGAILALRVHEAESGAAFCRVLRAQVEVCSFPAQSDPQVYGDSLDCRSCGWPRHSR